VIARALVLSEKTVKTHVSSILAKLGSDAPAAGDNLRVSGKSLLVRGLNVLAAAISTPLAAPVIAATRLRGGSAASARGAASFLTEAVGIARDTGCSATIVVRMDSAFYGSAAVHAVRRAGAYFSVTPQLNTSVQAAIAAIPATAWTPIAYPPGAVG
jgi:hypothetical protein